MNHISDELLNEYLDHTTPERAAVEAHLAVCTDCAARRNTMQALFSELESLPDVDLSGDLRAAVTRRVGGKSATPRWLTLTAGLQAAVASTTIILAAPFVIDLASSSRVVVQMPSFTGLFFQAQPLWVGWPDMLSQVQLPVMPELPFVPDMSGLYLALALTGTAVFWLVGNGILLRDRIKS